MLEAVFPITLAAVGNNEFGVNRNVGGDVVLFYSSMITLITDAKTNGFEFE